MAAGARPGSVEKFKMWTSNLSPELYEAKINLEDSKGSALFEKNLKVYNQLVEQEAKANRVSSTEVVRYMDEAYETALEDHQAPDIDVAVLANAR